MSKIMLAALLVIISTSVTLASVPSAQVARSAPLLETTQHQPWLEAASRQAPPSGYGGQYFTTQDNCTYSRTQAPGYPVMWILVLNPYTLGKPQAHRGCPGAL